LHGVLPQIPLGEPAKLPQITYLNFKGSASKRRSGRARRGKGKMERKGKG